MTEETNRAWKDQYMLRFPDGMRDRLKATAEQNGRSMNAEIITRLEASLAGADGEGDAIDQVFTSTMRKLAENLAPKFNQRMLRMAAEYDEYKQLQVQSLRRFLDLRGDVLREIEGIGDIDFDENSRRESQRALSMLKARANIQGYDLIKRKKGTDTSTETD
ncbi:Arc family DNA-binding protein [Rhizobium sp. TRM95111]|uniref:Arc family DNA-binding protein n=1 Tax=Rhizobium alarense TaxID=2846851 RepID=UPI001F187CA7|nr:Arc family DNA-binding protein [Rhizobium alarense]MCF3642911.1 Arc family DNA-binding protein [Rhizobium alarense]